MVSLGKKLRQARIDQGLELAALAARTKISARFLEAIEADRRDLVPAGFFFRNWAIQYADALALDPAEIQADIDRVLSTEAPLPLPGQVRLASKEGTRLRQNVYGRTGTPRLLVSFSLLFVVVLACSGLYTWWHQEKQARETVALKAPGAFQAPVVQAPGTTTPSPEAGKAATPPAKVPADAATSQNSDALLLELYAREQTWLVISPDGKQSFAGVLEANQTKTVEARESARIKVGNAGGVDIRLNGKSLGEIGPHGKVRILFVSPEGVRIFPRSPAELQVQPVAAMVSRRLLWLG